MNLEIIDIAQADRWLEILNMCYRYDFYHCPSYHQISENGENYRAKLLVYQEGAYVIAIPLVIRPISEIEGLESCEYYDATSVYGYAGPIASHGTVPERVVGKFQVDLQNYFVENDIVCTFSRLHPFINQQPLLEGFGSVTCAGQTISIDLGLPIDEQYSLFRRNHKRSLRELRRLGAYCIKSQQPSDYLETFIDMYHTSMKRAGAQEEYFFDRGYFEEILSTKDFDMFLFVCFLEDEIICAGLFSLCNGIVQSHLSAANANYMKLSPDTLLLDEVRIWANSVGASIFHLGGGLAVEGGSILHFKAGFSNTSHEFNVWKLVVMRNEYVELCRKKGIANGHASSEPIQREYFPIYRRPET